MYDAVNSQEKYVKHDFGQLENLRCYQHDDICVCCRKVDSGDFSLSQTIFKVKHFHFIIIFCLFLNVARRHNICCLTFGFKFYKLLFAIFFEGLFAANLKLV